MGMEYRDYVNELVTSLPGNGFDVRTDDPVFQSQGIDLLAVLPKYPKIIHRGNDTTVSVGVKYLEKADADGFSTFVGNFHGLIGSSYTSYQSLLERGANVNWRANLPVVVARAPESSAIEFVRSFKPDDRSKFQFVLDHPELVNIDTRETYHRDAPLVASAGVLGQSSSTSSSPNTCSPEVSSSTSSFAYLFRL
jgi:hypothetical protein